jgi:hypothetical protein
MIVAYFDSAQDCLREFPRWAKELWVSEPEKAYVSFRMPTAEAPSNGGRQSKSRPAVGPGHNEAVLSRKIAAHTVSNEV